MSDPGSWWVVISAMQKLKCVNFASLLKGPSFHDKFHFSRRNNFQRKTRIFNLMFGKRLEAKVESKYSHFFMGFQPLYYFCLSFLLSALCFLKISYRHAFCFIKRVSISTQCLTQFLTQCLTQFWLSVWLSFWISVWLSFWISFALVFDSVLAQFLTQFFTQFLAQFVTQISTQFWLYLSWTLSFFVSFFPICQLFFWE